jgi:hypothetical protein
LRRIALGFVLAAACGGEADPAADLEGSWIAEGPAGYDCAYGLEFDDGEYAWMTICTLEDGELGLQVERGTYVVGDERLTLQPTHSSCAEQSNVIARLGFAVDGDMLTLTSPAATVVYVRNEASADGSGAVPFGCYDSNGVFERAPIVEI